MICTALSLRHWLDMNSIVAYGRHYVIDHDSAIRIFYIHGDRQVEFVRELGPWEKDYAEHFATAMNTGNTLFICAGPEDVIH